MEVFKRESSGGHDRQHHTNPWLYAVKIGFFAGLIWGTVRWIFYTMKFTTVIPGFAADPFFRKAFLKTYWGIAFGIGAFVLISIIAALLYAALFRRLRGPWPGIAYGLAWWALIFIAAGPPLGMTERVTILGWNTLYSEICVFLLWGVFIGYSIAFEFTDEASREPMKAH
ncbi:YqhR family membrane protein [Paenibacillus harenae]|uniref:YqhR family membrane protein n=1 Tax=Paenibacillus harenae TaxID=306543 RepID=UPI000422D99F|nr:YqhR family membrane protein [Paenibacillus harenae]